MSTVQSIERAFSILRSLVAGPAGVSEIAERVQLPKSTVSRLLSTLEELGAVEQVTAGGEYRIGWTMIELSAAARPGRSLISITRPHLAELTRMTGEASGLSIPDGTEMLYLDQLTPDSELQVRDWTGHRIPMHTVPSGHIVMAFDAAIAKKVMAAPMPPLTPQTLTTPTALRKRLAAVRSTGYAWALREFAPEMNSVAAGVHGPDGRVVAVLHVHGPASRFPGERDRAELGISIKAVADNVRID